MKFTRFSILTLLAAIAPHATASVLPNSVQIEAVPKNSNVLSNTIKDSGGPGFISGYLSSSSLQPRNQGSIKCGDTCGTPPSEDCQQFIDNFDADGPNICAPDDSEGVIGSGDCLLAFGHLGSEAKCVQASVFKRAAIELLISCVEPTGTGGCAILPENSDLAVCSFTHEQKCIAEDLGL